MKRKHRHIDIIIPVLNPGKEFFEMLASLCKQKIDPAWTFNIIIVDDGSEQDNQFNTAKKTCSNIDIIHHEVNRGRASARNSGAMHAQGELLIFIDADCVFNNLSSIEEHRLKLFDEGMDVNFGRVNSYGDGFWSNYLSNVSKKRDAAGKSNDFMSLTSANFSIRSDVFKEVGGFDESYQKYGFEDRDFIACLINNKNKISYSPGNIVNHHDQLSLSTICHKLEQAGYYSAHLFASKHPQYYKNMSYRTLDVKYHPILYFPVKVMARFLPWFIKTGDKFLSYKILPFFLKKMLVISVTSLSFSWGTCKSTHETKSV